MLGSTVPGQEVPMSHEQARRVNAFYTVGCVYLVCIASVIIPGILFGLVTNLLYNLS